MDVIQQLSDGIYLVQFKSLEKNMLFTSKLVIKNQALYSNKKGLANARPLTLFI